MSPSLEVDVRFRRDPLALAAAFDCDRDRTVALLGPNGAGKSTLVGLLAGILRPAAGTVVLDGEVLDGGGRHVAPEQRPIGVVFQDLRLFPHLSALDNVAYPLRARGATRREARSRAAELLERLGVADRAAARPDALSGGQAQRVAVARALVHGPRLLLLDEPLSTLDVRARPATRTVLREALASFTGVRILVTHDPVEAMTLAEQIVIMEEGRVTQSGSPAEIRAAPRTEYAAALVGLNLFRGRLEALESGAGILRTPSGDVVVPWPGDVRGRLDGVVGLLRPGDVSLYRARPDGSARNVVHGRILSITLEGDRARIRIDGTPPLVADVTPGSVTRLGLAEGVEVWASFKAMEVSLILP